MQDNWSCHINSFSSSFLPTGVTGSCQRDFSPLIEIQQYFPNISFFFVALFLSCSSSCFSLTLTLLLCTLHIKHIKVVYGLNIKIYLEKAMQSKQKYDDHNENYKHQFHHIGSNVGSCPTLQTFNSAFNRKFFILNILIYNSFTQIVGL